MEWSWPESVLSNRERVMVELIQGRELASQLSRVFDNRSFVVVNGDDSGSDEDIVNKILGSFVNTLFILNGKESDQEFVSYDQIQGNSSGGSRVRNGSGDGGADSSSWDANHDHAAAIKSEDSIKEEISCKSTSTFKDRRGSCKRRKTSHSWTRDTPALTDDGHAWRKYGQKVIHNAKHPRNYFRCTHKFDQACKATKHVQHIQDHPPVFRTTYYGNHTCRDYLKASELVLNCKSLRDSSNFICFDNVNLTNKQEHPFFASFTSSSVKEEVLVKEEMPTSDHTVTTRHNSSPCDYLVAQDLTAFESSGPISGFSSSIDQYDHEDMFSRMIAESYFDNEVLQISGTS